jgi:undecaprenyl-diphosphatase
VIGLDHRFERWVVEHRVSWLDDVFVWISRIGIFGWVFIAVAAVAAIVLRRPKVLVLTLAAAILADLVSRGLKAAVDRPRPHLLPGEPHTLVPLPTDPSFPSTHATVGFACAVMLALTVPRLAVPVLVLAAAIAYSRVYLGVHYPLDVVCGAVIGASVAIALRALAGARRRPPPAPTPG